VCVCVCVCVLVSVFYIFLHIVSCSWQSLCVHVCVCVCVCCFFLTHKLLEQRKNLYSPQISHQTITAENLSINIIHVVPCYMYLMAQINVERCLCDMQRVSSQTMVRIYCKILMKYLVTVTVQSIQWSSHDRVWFIELSTQHSHSDRSSYKFMH
jgi:hypothetical protein